MQVAGPSVVLSATSVARPAFRAPGASATLAFSLQVADGRGQSASARVEVAVGSAAAQGRVVLAEVFVNPTGVDDSREWVRLFNGTDHAVDLSTFALAYGGSTTWGASGAAGL